MWQCRRSSRSSALNTLAPWSAREAAACCWGGRRRRFWGPAAADPRAGAHLPGAPARELHHQLTSGQLGPDLPAPKQCAPRAPPRLPRPPAGRRAAGRYLRREPHHTRHSQRTRTLLPLRARRRLWGRNIVANYGHVGSNYQLVVVTVIESSSDI